MRALLACRQVRGLPLQIALKANLLAKVADAAMSSAKLAVDDDGRARMSAGTALPSRCGKLNSRCLCLERRVADVVPGLMEGRFRRAVDHDREMHPEQLSARQPTTCSTASLMNVKWPLSSTDQATSGECRRM